jgi:transposase
MRDDITYVGMDVHKKGTKVAMQLPGREEAEEFSCATEVGRLVRRIKKASRGEIRCCYEAGPSGYWLQRELSKRGVACMVVAPSLIPRKPGERIKTDRRDARKLARALRAGDLTEVHPPTPEQEAARDLCRAREDAKGDLKRSRHRLQKYLYRRGVVWGKRSWTLAHRAWLRTLRFSEETEQAVLDDYLCAVQWQEERVKGLEAKLEGLSKQEPYVRPVGLLRCFRGIDTVTAMTLVCELHGFMRFGSARGLMAYLGMIPSEASSGERRRQGSITKTGNGHVRRVLVEAAWHYRHRPSVGQGLRQRRKGQPGWVIAQADRAQQRLHRRYWWFLARGKPSNKAVVAVGRELVGFLWAVLYPDSLEPQRN